MELPFGDENGSHLVIDCDTIIDNESDSLESSTCDIQTVPTDKTSVSNLLDKAVSVDESDLATPLEPTQARDFPANSQQPSDESCSDISLKSEEDFDCNDCHDEDVTEQEDDFQDASANEEGEESQEEEKAPVLFPEGLYESEVNIIEAELPPVLLPEEILPVNITNPVDEEMPLVVVQDHALPDYNDDMEIETSEIQKTPRLLNSILRRAKQEHADNHRNVSFPDNDSLLCTYREPDFNFYWSIGREMSAEEILQVYQESCKKHQTIELDAIVSQILEIKNNINHSANFKLCGIKVSPEVNETLEDLLKVTNFHCLTLSGCVFNPETMNEFMNMLEFYQSTKNFEIELNFEDDATLMIFCNICGHMSGLESISFKKMDINESAMRSLMGCIRHNSNINTLKFDSCSLIKLPNFYLIESLMMNTTIRELYLPSTGLYTKEAEVIARFLMSNAYLKVLDIGNNFIGDRGLESLSKGLCTPNTPGSGLSALSVFNNQITEKSGPIISVIISDCKNLHTFNLGYNNLTDQVLINISEGLPYAKSIEGLGLQCTLLTCKGIDALAAAIPQNSSLRKINLKGNKAIQLMGVAKLCEALTNSTIFKIEIDETNRSCNDPEAYVQLVKQLFAICNVNKSIVERMDVDETTTVSQLVSRKMSLSCEPRYNMPEPTMFYQGESSRLSPITSPAPTAVATSSPNQSSPSSPAPRSRFMIVRVDEDANGNANSAPRTPSRPSPRPPTNPPRHRSRFQVTRVLPSPDEEISLGRFANVRSSVSSNDSLDSLTTAHLDSESDE